MKDEYLDVLRGNGNAVATWSRITPTSSSSTRGAVTGRARSTGRQIRRGSRWRPTNPRPFPMVRDRRGWASVRSQARAVGEVQVHDAARCGCVIRARLLARSETTLPRRRRPLWLARRAHRPARDADCEKMMADFARPVQLKLGFPFFQSPTSWKICSVSCPYTGLHRHDSF